MVLHTSSVPDVRCR